MERALPMNEEENLLWEKWKESGVSEQQRSHLLIQHRLEERKKKEYECNRKNDENQQRRADMQLLPFTKEEKRLWRQWTRQGITGRDRRKLRERKAKGTKITRLHTEERTRLRTEERNRQEERKRGRHIFRMPFWRPLHPRCLGGVYLHQQAHDTHVHHLDNRHATGDGLWLMAIGSSVCTC